MPTQTMLGGESFRHNGWLNYATWRVNMELCDCIGADLSEQKQTFDDMSDLADHIKEYCEGIVTEDTQGCNAELVNSYALAFMQYVDWREIAEHIAEDYPSLVIEKHD